MPKFSAAPTLTPQHPGTGGRPTRPLAPLVLAGVILAGASVQSPAQSHGAAEARIHPSDWPARTGVAPTDPTIEKQIAELLGKMTLEEKVGQLLQPDISSATPDDVRRYHLGSVLAGGNAAPNGDVRSPPAAWLRLTDAYFRASLDASGLAHAPIPIIFGIDAVHGHARMPGATVFPHNVGLGAAHDPQLIERIGKATAEEVAATGIDWTFAPTVAVVRDPRWGRSYESYSEDPTLVADYARAMVVGLQGRAGTPDFMAPGRTLASVKHFLGDGSTIRGRDQFDSRIPEIELRDVHAPPYPAALSAGALIVMASYNGWHGTKMHDNTELLTGVLKERWAFPGFIVGDWNGHEEIPGCTKWSCPDVLRAGLDMYMAPDSWKKLYDNLLVQVRNGSLAESRVDDAVRRVLRVKATAGILSRKAPEDRSETADLTVIGSAEHRSIAREAVRKSVVLLKNNRQLLPLDPHARILVTGPGADDIGMQSGGWTVDWQGAHNRNSDFPGGTSVFAGIRQAVTAAGGPARTLYASGHVTAPWSVYVADSGAEVRLTMDSQASPGGVVTASLETPTLNGRWTGTGRGEFRIGGRMADFRSAAAAGTEVVARLQVRQPATARVGVGIRCDAPYGTIEPTDPAAPRTNWPRCGTKGGALLDLSRLFSRSAPGQWQTVHVPLRCLSEKGADLTNVVAPFVIDTSGKLAVSIQGVHLEQGSAITKCPPLLDPTAEHQ